MACVVSTMPTPRPRAARAAAPRWRGGRAGPCPAVGSSRKTSYRTADERAGEVDGLLLPAGQPSVGGAGVRADAEPRRRGRRRRAGGRRARRGSAAARRPGSRTRRRCSAASGRPRRSRPGAPGASPEDARRSRRRAGRGRCSSGSGWSCRRRSGRGPRSARRAAARRPSASSTTAPPRRTVRSRTSSAYAVGLATARSLGRSRHTSALVREGSQPGARGAGRMAPMDLPVMPPVAPMLAKSVKEIPTGDVSLRAQVGRLPLDHLPRRRRGRDRQPQREADDPLLPRGGRGGARELAERCVVDGEIVVVGDAATGSTSRRCSSASTRRRQPGRRCWPRRRRPASSPSTCWPSATRT